MPVDKDLQWYNATSSAGAEAAVLPLASATQTASGNGTTFAIDDISKVDATLVVSAASGTTPSLTVNLQVTADGTNWKTLDSFPAQTTTTAGVRWVFNVDTWVSARWTWTISGTTPSFTFAVTAAMRKIAQ